MAEADIPAQGTLSKRSVTLAPSPFEVWTAREGYNVAPAESPPAIRQYTDPQTQAAFDAWTAGGRVAARMITESTLGT